MTELAERYKDVGRARWSSSRSSKYSRTMTDVILVLDVSRALFHPEIKRTIFIELSWRGQDPWRRSGGRAAKEDVWHARRKRRVRRTTTQNCSRALARKLERSFLDSHCRSRRRRKYGYKMTTCVWKTIVEWHERWSRSSRSACWSNVWFTEGRRAHTEIRAGSETRADRIVRLWLC